MAVATAAAAAATSAAAAAATVAAATAAVVVARGTLSACKTDWSDMHLGSAGAPVIAFPICIIPR